MKHFQCARWKGGNKIVLLPAAVLAATLLLGPMLDREALAVETTFGGFVNAYYYSSSRELDHRQNLTGSALQPKLDLRLSPGFSLHAEGRAIWEDPWKGVHVSLREGYADYSMAAADLRIGKQIITWGRADTINPTDNLTPSDYTLLFPEDDDLKRGIPAVNFAYTLGTVTLTGIWIPSFQPSRIPLPIPRSQISEIKPDTNLENSEYAVKIDRTGKLLDWSLSFFDGFDLLPDAGLRNGVTLTYPRIQVAGGDFAATAGKYGFRGEAAYFFTPDSAGDNPFRKNPFFYYVLGVDRTYAGSLYVNLQFIQRLVTRFRDPEDLDHPQARAVAVLGALINQQMDRVTNSISLKVQHKAFYETLKTEVSGVYNLTRKDYLLRPRVYYSISDHYSLTLGLDLYGGKEESFFGLLKDNTTAFVEFRIGF